ncbi:hypothetical protein GCM10010191_79960 [Actinomadura vinacea]|uniref:Uncharacterized protein n=1 Tax=Actinomadura vinacea TaxID=115336 RepID=A0ABN3K5K2_9ACTN
MCALIFEYGIDTESWYAEFALRRRVSMSAIGSVIVMGFRPSLATVSSGTSPWTFGAVVDALLRRPGGYYSLGDGTRAVTSWTW